VRNRLAAICLGLEAFVVFFATLVAASLAPVPTATAWIAGLVLTVACILGAGLVRRPGGIAVGWVLQGLVLATGFWVPAMFALGGIFLLIWVWFLLLGNRIDRDRARWARDRGDDRSAGVPPSTG